MLNLNEIVNRIVSIIQKGEKFLLITHLRPDGDAVGSIAAFANAIKKIGKKAYYTLVDPVPERFSFLLKGLDEIHPDQLNLFESGLDAIFVLDTGDLPRTGLQQKLQNPPAVIVNIDHHVSNVNFGDINLVLPNYNSTCEIIFMILDKAKIEFDSKIASPLYLGLCTDTRFFQIENIRPEAHYTAQRLLEIGLDIPYLHGKLLSTKRPEELKILGYALTNIKYTLDNKIAYVVISLSDMQQHKVTMADVFACGIFGQLTTIDGVIVGVGMVENIDKKIYVEFRSRYGFNVKDIAVELGGGGHIAASGCTLSLPLNEAIDKVLNIIQDKLKSFNANLP